MRILKKQTAALVIDMQEKLMPHIHNNKEISARIVTLVSGLQQLAVPILFSQQYTKGLGGTTAEVRQACQDFTYIEKSSFSCCDEPSFTERLGDLDKKFVIIAGVEAHVCVQQTVIDLLEKGWIPVVVDDCVSSRKERDKLTALARMRQEGAIITGTESLLFELCRYSNSEVFRGISNLVK